MWEEELMVNHLREIYAFITSNLANFPVSLEESNNILRCREKIILPSETF